MVKDIHSALAWGGAYLKNCGIENPFLDAQVLLAHCTRLDKIALYLNDKRLLSPAEQETYRRLVLRRAKREPAAYLTGYREFMGLDFAVNPSVLIPRPETELLVEKSLELSAGIKSGKPLQIADVGTGCGAVAISLARYLPGSRLYAIDISPAALKTAKKNAAIHGLADSITFLEGDLLFPLNSLAIEGGIDLIAANLPYVKTSDLTGLMPDVGLFEPRLALDGGPDGLYFYRRILPQARKFLSRYGFLLMEIGADQYKEISLLLNSEGWKYDLVKDLAGLYRLVVAKQP